MEHEREKKAASLDTFQFELLNEVESVLQEVIDELRPFFLGSVKRVLDKNARTQGGWQPIVSLSSLRSTVGGRFETLKDLWTTAGLPLRAHRGDDSDHYTLHEDGWLELCRWLSQKGYQVKPDGNDDRTLFSIRKVDF